MGYHSSLDLHASRFIQFTSHMTPLSGERDISLFGPIIPHRHRAELSHLHSSPINGDELRICYTMIQRTRSPSEIRIWNQPLFVWCMSSVYSVFVILNETGNRLAQCADFPEVPLSRFFGTVQDIWSFYAFCVGSRHKPCFYEMALHELHLALSSLRL